MIYPINYKWGVLEEISINSGIITINGWAKNIPNVRFNNTEGIGYRIYRPDVANALKVDNCYYGFSFESMFVSKTKICINGEIITYVDGNKIKPHYSSLLNTQEVYKREDIYGFGPPVNDISVEILNLINQLKGNVLDFGCGKGKTVELLRTQGTEAYGIEIDRQAIRNSIVNVISPYITLYDGNLPSPYSDNQFDNIICIEVLEHIPDFKRAIKEFNRVSNDKVIITVPDISAIPRLHQFGVIPWHLLESTHVNFFTQQSLHKELEPYFKKIEFMKICPININRKIIYTSLVAVCTK